MEEASEAALCHDTDLCHTLNLFHNGLKLAIRAAVLMAQWLTYKVRKRLKQKAYLKKHFNLSSLMTEEDKAELEWKAEKITELVGFCGKLPNCEVKATEAVFVKIREVFGKEEWCLMAALQHPVGVEGEPVTFAETEVEKAELLADVYTSVGAEPLSTVLEQPEGTAKSDAAIRVVEVIEALRCQPDGKVAGLDSIKCGPLKHLSEHGVLLLCRIFELVYQNREWPRDWVLVCIVPVLKLGKDLLLGGSYWPVSLMLILAKLCERVIGGRLKQVMQGCISDTHFVASVAVDNMAGGVHLVAHMSMQQAAKLSVLLCFSFFVGFFLPFPGYPSRALGYRIFCHRSTLAKGGLASTCTHLQHSHTHTQTPPSLFPRSLGTSWVLFPVASQLYVVTWLALLTKQKKYHKNSRVAVVVYILLVIFSPARLISGWSLKFPALSLFSCIFALQ